MIKYKNSENNVNTWMKYLNRSHRSHMAVNFIDHKPEFVPESRHFRFTRLLDLCMLAQKPKIRVVPSISDTLEVLFKRVIHFDKILQVKFELCLLKSQNLWKSFFFWFLFTAKVSWTFYDHLLLPVFLFTNFIRFIVALLLTLLRRTYIICFCCCWYSSFF